MKYEEKIVSFMLAGVLCASMPLTAFATESTAPDSKEIVTDGTVNYANTTVYSVTLPTDDCFNFTVDPQGILSSVDPGTYTTDLYPNGTAGYIIATQGGGAYINNKSSVPIKLMVEAYVESDVSGAESSVNLVSDGNVASGIDNNMWLTLDITHDLTDADGNPAVLADATAITNETVNPNVLAITKNGAPADATEKGTQISFALNQAEYQFTDAGSGNYTYDMKAGELGDSVGMRLSGLVNTEADWSAYAGSSAEKIMVKTVFEFDKLSTSYDYAAGNTLDGRAHGVLADVAPEYFAGMGYDDTGAATGPIAGAMDYTVGSGAIEIPFNFGVGINEVKIDAITVNGTAIADTDYKVMDGVISLKSTEDNVKAAMDAATPEGTPAEISITTDDTYTTVVTVNMYA